MDILLPSITKIQKKVFSIDYDSISFELPTLFELFLYASSLFMILLFPTLSEYNQAKQKGNLSAVASDASIATSECEEAECTADNIEDVVLEEKEECDGMGVELEEESGVPGVDYDVYVIEDIYQDSSSSDSESEDGDGYLDVTNDEEDISTKQKLFQEQMRVRARRNQAKRTPSPTPGTASGTHVRPEVSAERMISTVVGSELDVKGVQDADSKLGSELESTLEGEICDKSCMEADLEMKVELDLGFDEDVQCFAGLDSPDSKGVPFESESKHNTTVPPFSSKKLKRSVEKRLSALSSSLRHFGQSNVHVEEKGVRDLYIKDHPQASAAISKKLDSQDKEPRMETEDSCQEFVDEIHAKPANRRTQTRKRLTFVNTNNLSSLLEDDEDEKHPDSKFDAKVTHEYENDVIVKDEKAEHKEAIAAPSSLLPDYGRPEEVSLRKRYVKPRDMVRDSDDDSDAGDTVHLQSEPAAFRRPDGKTTTAAKPPLSPEKSPKKSRFSLFNFDIYSPPTNSAARRNSIFKRK